MVLTKLMSFTRSSINCSLEAKVFPKKSTARSAPGTLLNTYQLPPPMLEALTDSGMPSNRGIGATAHLPLCSSAFTILDITQQPEGTLATSPSWKAFTNGSQPDTCNAIPESTMRWYVESDALSTSFSAMSTLSPSSFTYHAPADCIMMRTWPRSLGSNVNIYLPVAALTSLPISMYSFQVRFCMSSCVYPAAWR